LATYPGIVNPTIQRMIDIPMCALTPSKVVQFLNMATPDDLLDDEYFEILYEDIMTVIFFISNRRSALNMEMWSKW
jgi:hypothetical protein